MENDMFFELPRKTLKKVKDILVWANKNKIKTRLDIMPENNVRRIRVDRTFDEILNMIKEEHIEYIRIILRKNMLWWGNLSEDPYKRDDVLEVAIFGLREENEGEYLIFIWVDKNKLDELKRKYNLKEMGN